VGPVPSGCPFRLTDAQLDETLRGMIEEIPGFNEYRAIVPELKLTLVLIGAQDGKRRLAFSNFGENPDRRVRCSSSSAGVPYVPSGAKHS
jgi:hypothetical protein